MAFADDFWDRAGPGIRAAAKSQAFLVAIGTDEFEDAYAVVHAIARAAGAGLLDEDQYEQMRSWIQDTLWTEFSAAEVRIAAIRGRSDAAMIADPVRYYAGLCARTSDPFRMQWVFAAICPEYRAYLIAARHADASR